MTHDLAWAEQVKSEYSDRGLIETHIYEKDKKE